MVLAGTLKIGYPVASLLLEWWFQERSSGRVVALRASGEQGIRRGLLGSKDEAQGLKKIYSKIAANSAEDLIFRNHSLLDLANLYFEKCDFRNSVECLEKVKVEALQFHLYENYFKSVSTLLRIHAERLELEKIQSLVREVMQVGDSLEDFSRFTAKIEYNQAIYYSYAREFAKARDHFENSETAARVEFGREGASEKDRAEAARDILYASFGQASVASSQGRLLEALERLDILDGMFARYQEFPQEILRTEHLEASILVARGNIQRELGDYPKALDAFWKAHGRLKAQRVWSYYYYVLLGLGRIYLAMEDASRASIFFDLVSDAVTNLELHSLREILERENLKVKNSACRLVVDRERKVVVEKEKGEVHFERRFILLEILYLLASEPGKIFTKDMLVDKIWKESYNPMIHDSKVYTSISRLRKLIEPDFKRPRYILNERDGYSFNPAIQIEELGNWRKDLQQSNDRIRTSVAIS